MVATLSELTDVLFEKVLKKRAGASKKDARIAAEYVLEIFGYNMYVADNMLRAVGQDSNKIRDLFYMLEEEGILGMYSEDVTVPVKNKPKDWRVFYWYFRPDWNKLKQMPTPKIANEYETLYDKVPDEIWDQLTA